ncbi:uncharacterized protein LOC144162965 isoform X2 [Haemaphysalis longicornis]
MSEDVLETLHSVLRRLTVTELRSLDELSFSWLPSLQELSLRPAVNTIVGSLQAIESRSKRLEGVALIYAWLLPVYHQPWMLFSVEEASELSDFRRLLTKSASALRLRSHEVEGTPGVLATAIPPSRDAVPDMLPLDVNNEKTKKRLVKWEAALAELGSLLRPVEHSYKITDKSGSTWVSFDGPDLMEKLRRLYAYGFKEIISPAMLPAFLGQDSHVVDDRD